MDRSVNPYASPTAPSTRRYETGAQRSFASIHYNREYFETFYDNWLVYRSRCRGFAIPVALFFVAVTANVFFAIPEHRLIVGGLVIVAVLNLIDAATHRRRWIRQRLASVAVDKTANFTFTEDTIQIATPNSQSTLSYSAFGLVLVTPKGIFLVPDSGVSIFVPQSAFATIEDFTVALNLAQQAAQNPVSTHSTAF